MLGFNYKSFKEALKRAQEENHVRLMDEIEKVKAFVEKALTMFFESSANLAKLEYPGVEV